MSDINEEEVDPDLAALLDDVTAPPAGGPSFEDLFNETPGGEKFDPADAAAEEDISKEEFPVIKEFSCSPHALYNDPEYYKKVLNKEGESAPKVHKYLSLFMTSKDSGAKTDARNRLVPAIWDLYRSIAVKSEAGLKGAKKHFLRFGMLLPKVVTPAQRKMIASFIPDNPYGEPIHYLDEWLLKVATAEVAPLASDEVKQVARNKDESKLKMKLEKAKGHAEASSATARTSSRKRTDLAKEIALSAEALTKHTNHSSHKQGILSPYSRAQRASIQEMMEKLKELSLVDKELSLACEKMKDAESAVESLSAQMKEKGIETKVDSSVVKNEMNSIQQMIKMSVGRQGNHFPCLYHSYFSENPDQIATRENVIANLAKIEAIDPGAFRRIHRQKSNRIVPHVILMPCYGEVGVCWEPFERFNRATSRGRVGVPLYPKDVFTAVLYAVADLRWQVAKEKAQHYWMEEGLTGQYYQWFSDRKLKGDVRNKFIEDYVLWITKESEGVQKLDKEVRNIFWRIIPFSQERKDDLKNRGFVYSELYKKDQNRAMSDGY